MVVPTLLIIMHPVGVYRMSPQWNVPFTLVGNVPGGKYALGWTADSNQSVKHLFYSSVIKSLILKSTL